jgi:zeaxanthin glucosyltransferase
MHFGIITPPVTSHIHVFASLGRELIARGHRVTVFHMPDVEQSVRSQGLDFVPIGAATHPPGTLPRSLARRAELDGFAALRFTVGEIKSTTEMMLRDAPAALSSAKVNVLLVDQMEAVGATLADRLNLPFFTICSGLALNQEPDIPPPFSDWDYSPASAARLRNRAGYVIADQILKPIAQVIAKQRRAWNLTEHKHPSDSFSPLAQFCQQPAAFDFPRKQLPSTFHYVGPLRTPMPSKVPFPWDKLNGKPLVYASLGSQLNRKLDMFQVFAEACSHFPVQLAITLAGGSADPSSLNLPGKPIVVGNAPQMEVLARTSIAITHAGLNTVLDALSFGVPTIAVPIMSEQPAIGKRLVWCGAGLSIPFKNLTVDRLKTALAAILENPRYREHARALQLAIENAGGVTRTADTIESILSGRKPGSPAAKLAS